MKLIFLDIDGVLNSTEFWVQQMEKTGRVNSQSVSPVLVERFNRIVERTGAQVVLSSTWRRSGLLRGILQAAGLEWFKITPTRDWVDGKFQGFPERWERIQKVLEEIEDVSRFAILDDDWDARIPDQKDSFFHINREVGLTEDDVERIVSHLGEKDER